MRDYSLDRVEELLTGAKQVSVFVRVNPSIDSMAAALSLGLGLEKVGKSVSVLCDTLPTVLFGNLRGVHKVKRGNGNSTNVLVISLPYRQGAIEKISYDIVGDRINLTVVPGTEGINFTSEDVTYQLPHETVDLAFAIDISDESYLAQIRANSNANLITIDRASQNGSFGTVSIVDPSSSSTSEIVARLLRDLNLPIDNDIAQNLLIGIVDETDNFQSPHTSMTAFEQAAFLMEKGARREDIGKKVDDGTAWQPAQTKKTQNTRSFAQDQSALGSTHQPLQDRGKAASNAAVPPKDWFEPKIYKGSTQI